MRNTGHDRVNREKRLQYTGATNYTSQGELITLVKYNTARSVVVRFSDGAETETTLLQFKRGQLKKPIQRVGVINHNTAGDLMEVISYRGYADIDVQFKDEYAYIANTSWQKFERGQVKNPYHPLFNGGIVGSSRELERFFAKDQDISRTKEYRAWSNILTRCTNDYYLSNPTYKGCTVDDSWLCFWNFLDWVTQEPNYSHWSKGWAIDKDICCQGNKLYSPSTCFLVPKSINNLLLNHGNARGDYRTGVSRRISDGKYEAQCSVNGKKYLTLGLFLAEEDAHKAYAKAKHEIVQQTALKSLLMGDISKACYDALVDRNFYVSDS